MSAYLTAGIDWTFFQIVTFSTHLLRRGAFAEGSEQHSEPARVGRPGVTPTNAGRIGQLGTSGAPCRKSWLRSASRAIDIGSRITLLG